MGTPTIKLILNIKLLCKFSKIYQEWLNSKAWLSDELEIKIFLLPQDYILFGKTSTSLCQV